MRMAQYKGGLYVVYHIKSTQSEKCFNLASSAKRSCTWKNKKLTLPEYAWTEASKYTNEVVKMKKVTNFMSGIEIEIPSNTPRCCDPSSELYWSM